MLDPSEAAAILRSAETSQRHSIETYRYNRCAPYLYIWGVAWMAGYLGCAVSPDRFDTIMPLAMWSAIVASILWSIAGPKSARRIDWRIAASFLVMWIFTYSLFALLPPNPRAIAAYFPLLFSAVYAGAGIWIGLRYVVIGAALAMATLCGYFLLKNYFFVWMALFGGAALILTGAWLKRA
jgi:hypothetical protein